jgi:hypothetical protein
MLRDRQPYLQGIGSGAGVQVLTVAAGMFPYRATRGGGTRANIRQFGIFGNCRIPFGARDGVPLNDPELMPCPISST